MSTQKRNVPYLIFICAIASVSGIILGYDASVISGVIDPLTEHLSLTPAQSGWAVSNVILGCIVGAWGVGRFTDRFGRKATLIITAILFAISAIGSALAGWPWAWHLLSLHSISRKYPQKIFVGGCWACSRC